MAKKKAVKPAKRRTRAVRVASGPDDSAKALREVGAAIAELRNLSYLEQTGDNLGEMAGALRSVASAIAASAIAQHGTPDERRQAVEHLKEWFWESDAFKK